MFLRIETDTAIYETQFRYYQVEITGKCNMACQHCRASVQLGNDMSQKLLRRIVRFGNKYLEDTGEVVISGGDPLVHRQWKSMLNVLVDEGVKRISLTTNGLLFSNEHAEFLKHLPMDNILLAFSLDSKNAETHNSFRRNRKAYNGVIRALDIAHEHGLHTAIRSTIWDLKEIDGIVEIAHEHGCGMVGFSDVHRFGEALNHPELFMDVKQKHLFHEKLKSLNTAGMCVGTSDPLFREKDSDSVLRGGCGAGFFTFNVNVDGSMTPCAFLPQIITVINERSSVSSIAKSFSESDVVRNIMEMNYRGKCGECSVKTKCGGCRARAFAYSGDYLQEDPHCYY